MIYSLQPARLHRQSRLLRNALLSRVDGESFSLELTDLNWLATPRMRLAAIEAVSSAQQFLFERAIETTRALADITISAALVPHGSLCRQDLQLMVAHLPSETASA